MYSILTIIPFDFYPPVTGGALRCFHIIKEVSKLYVVHVLTIQSVDDFYESGTFAFNENVKIKSITARSNRASSIFGALPIRVFNALQYRYIRRSLKGRTNQFLLDIYPVLKDLLNKLKVDVILFENLEAVELTSKLCRKLAPNSVQVYDAHNVDSELWFQIAKSQESVHYKKYALNALATERKLYKKVNAFFSCSFSDYNNLLSLNKGEIFGTVIPNGVDTELKSFDDNINKYAINQIIFCGTLDTVPNKEGLLWFYDKVFPLLKRKCPEVSLTVIGKVTHTKYYEQLINDPSVDFIGNVEEVTPYYKKSSVAIVPLLSGSGTRLKILEAMSLGNPIVSTSVGAEGIDCVSGENIYISDQPEEFAHNIASLIGNLSLFNKLRFEALELVKSTYDWKVIGAKVNDTFKSLLENESVKRSRE